MTRSVVPAHRRRRETHHNYRGNQVDDITRRKQMEEALRRRNRELAMLNRAGRLLNSSLDLDHVLTTVLEEMRGFLKIAACSVWLMDQETDELVCQQATGPQSELVRGWRLALGEGLAGWVARRGESLIVPDTRADERHFKGVDQETGLELRSVLGVPLKVGPDTIGVLQVGSMATDRFKPADLTLIEALADVAAIAIDNARLYRQAQQDIAMRKGAEETLRRRLAELTVLHAVAIAGAEATSEDALIERATQVIGETLYPDNFGLVLVDEAADVLRAHPSYRGMRARPGDIAIPLGQGVTGRVASTGQPWRVPDVTREPAYRDVDPDMRSELCVPLKAGERIIGVINAESRHPDAFSEADERLMTTLAGQLATAIEKVRLLEAERQRAREAETLRQAGAVVAATLQQDEAIARILQELARVVPHDSASVQLLHEGWLEIVGGRGWPDPAAVVGLRFPVPSDAAPNTAVIQQRRPHILADAPTVYAAFREEPHSHIRSWLGVPLIVGDRVIGMLAVDSAQPNHFTPDHARLAAAFADQVAIAIENARLFDEVQQLAITDSLTGLYNRRHFFELAALEFDRARRYQRPLSALMLDIDHFKQVNDTYGHTIGDQVLRAVAERCRKHLRKFNVLGRYGGEEFVALLPETEPANARLVAERLRQGIADLPIDTERAVIAITISVGVGGLDEECLALECLLERADWALYAAKQAGRDRVHVWQRGAAISPAVG